MRQYTAVAPQVGEDQKLVDAVRHVARGPLLIEVERMRQPLLVAALLSNHPSALHANT